MATILIVDDRPTNREYLVTLLGYCGHRLLEAADGARALDVVRAEQPDLVITDVLMPIMDGYEFVRRLRAEPARAATPVVFYTATYLEGEARSLAAACGVSHVLTKPGEPEEIVRVVGETLAGTAAAAPATLSDEFEQRHQQLLMDKLATHVRKLEQEIAEREQAEESLKKLSRALDQIADTVIITDKDGVIEYVNSAFETVTGYSKEEAIGRNPNILKSGKHDQQFYQQLWATILAGGVFRTVFTNKKESGELYEDEQIITPITDRLGDITHFVATGRDITERILLENQLRQAQKMEAVGRLTGGISHDFNNLLTVILSFSDILLRNANTDSREFRQLKEIRKAGERAAALIDQLLAFSRKQVLQPRILDLNAVISDIEKMLRRVIGEDIDLVTVLEPALSKVKVDPSQIDQIIMNLAVNARDAMPRGGDLTIETANVELDEAYARNHVDVKPGPYVMLAVSDTGSGMDQETLSHIFEPFFTTKELGKGTGLGLATVFGIARQSDGHIWVYSEPGKGTTFKIYLPLLRQHADASAGAGVLSGCLQGTETILVVEDDAAMRSLVSEMLQEAGYAVLLAAGTEEALQLCEQNRGAIHLLLTDVVMPKQGGRELAAQMSGRCPGIRILFMSGYTDDTIVRHGVLSSTMAFLQKPFTEVGLLRKVREVLDESATGL